MSIYSLHPVENIPYCFTRVWTNSERFLLDGSCDDIFSLIGSASSR